MSGDNVVEFEDVTCTQATDKAILCVIAGEDVWVPKSQVFDADKNSVGKLVLTRWFAEKRGLV